jgi:hypothetical protein
MLSKPTKIQSQTPDLNRVQDSIQKAFNPLAQNALLDGVLLTSVALKSGSNTINHTLGRNLSGWVVVRQRASASFYDTQDSNSLPALTLNLTSSANVTVDLYVF